MDNQEYEREPELHQKKKINKGRNLVIFILIVCVATGIYMTINLPKGQQEEPEIISKTTLEKIINVSELSTYKAVYNGVAVVMNEKKPEKVDYYVAYEANIFAGFNFEGLTIDKDEKTKKIIVTIPKITFMEPDLDELSLDYMFQNSKANKSTVSEQAIKACYADIRNESAELSAVIRLAVENAKNIIYALVVPFVNQLDSEYELEIITGGIS